jgi:valyl-tRNA synthetase
MVPAHPEDKTTDTSLKSTVWTPGFLLPQALQKISLSVQWKDMLFSMVKRMLRTGADFFIFYPADSLIVQSSVLINSCGELDTIDHPAISKHILHYQ